MALRQFVPSPDLRSWVDRFWIRSSDAGSAVIPVLPDGAADIVFDLGTRSGALSDTFVVGAMTRPLILEGPAPDMLGIRFRPGRAGSFLRCRLGEVTDERVPLASLGLRGWRTLAERIGTCGTDGERIGMVEDAVRVELRGVVADVRIAAAVELIERTAGRASVEETAVRTGLTRQHLARLFDAHVGLGPKTFARIVRFRRAARLGRRMPWSDVAATLGYADQSHLIAEFRAFAGTSPVPFLLSGAANPR